MGSQRQVLDGTGLCERLTNAIQLIREHRQDVQAAAWMRLAVSVPKVRPT
jgi:hypothetical protein